MTSGLKYGLGGALGGLAVGASFVSLTNYYLSMSRTKSIVKKADRSENASDSKMDQEMDDSISKFFKSVPADPQTAADAWTNRTALYACSILCACLLIGNIRFYQMWKHRYKQKRFDADAFQRGFEKFMNENESESHTGANEFFQVLDLAHIQQAGRGRNMTENNSRRTPRKHGNIFIANSRDVLDFSKNSEKGSNLSLSRNPKGRISMNSSMPTLA
mmetsp:Transcript_18852/g.51905  ORF Transcript_18852/g.51905 Transcript_18852/m.51905 type:complete len:217 (-) Transcript_18852:257-907(-)